MKAAKALDISTGDENIRSGDQVAITFDGGTDGTSIAAGNIDEALAWDSGHTWKDGGKW